MGSTYFFALLLQCLLKYASSQTGSSLPIEPYLLVADVHGILRVSMDGNHSYHYLVKDYGISAIDYHYERGLLFWVNQRFPALKFTSLINETEITEIYASRMKSPTGVAVDWINDRVYWIERGNRIIRVYDLNTEITSKVLDLPSSALSMKLKILPHIGLFFWGDKNNQGIQRSSINRSIVQREIITDVFCPNSVAVDFKTGNVYTIDACTAVFKKCKIDGSHENIISRNIGIGLVSGLCMHNDKLFCTVQLETANVNYVIMENTTSYEYFKMQYDAFRDIAIVHPSNQLSETELKQYNLCSLVCHHGNCTWDGQCICEEGWTGLDCVTDINECENDNGGCEEQCENLPGSYFCNCTDGKELSLDEKTCVEPPTSASTPPPYTSASNTTSVAPTNASYPQSTSINYTDTSPSNFSESTTSATDIFRHRGDRFRNNNGARVPVNRIGTLATSPVETSANNWDTTDASEYSSQEKEMSQTTDDVLFLLNQEISTVNTNEKKHSSIAVIGTAITLTIILILLLFGMFLYIKCKHQQNKAVMHTIKMSSMEDNGRLSLQKQLEYESEFKSTNSDSANRCETPPTEQNQIIECGKTQTTTGVEHRDDAGHLH